MLRTPILALFGHCVQRTHGRFERLLAKPLARERSRGARGATEPRGRVVRPLDLGIESVECGLDRVARYPSPREVLPDGSVAVATLREHTRTLHGETTVVDVARSSEPGDRQRASLPRDPASREPLLELVGRAVARGKRAHRRLDGVRRPAHAAGYATASAGSRSGACSDDTAAIVGSRRAETICSSPATA